MNDELFVLVLNSLYNSPQFTFFLSVLLPLPVLSRQLLYIWTLSPFLTGLSSSCLDLPLPFPHALYFMLILTTWGCWYFPPFFWLFHTCLPNSGSAPELPAVRVTYLCRSTWGCVCRVPPHLHKLGARHVCGVSVRVVRLFAICSRVSVHTLDTIRNKIVRYDSRGTAWTVRGIRIWEGVAWVFLA